MPRRPIFTDVMDVLERRILEGDYMLKDLPGERKLAEEVGVSYMTARKAVLGLIEKNVLTRKDNGALAIHPRYHAKQSRCQVALLSPAYPSAHFMHCRLAISRSAEKHDVQFRPVEYMHWYDPAVKEALQGSDGLLVIPSTEPMPPQVLKEFASHDHKVVFLDDDMTDHGIPSIRLFARDHISTLFEHLWELGHRTLHCLNAQGHNPEIDRRISHWQTWLEEKGGNGKLWDTPAPPYDDVISHAYQTMRQLVAQRNEIQDAIVCTTQPAALGAIRACYEQGLRIGEDVSICTINNEPTGRYFCPTLTGLEMPDIEDLMTHCFAWFAADHSAWKGPLRIVPEHARLFKGESTGHARVHA
ncbi:substrate-binding domain-containing protein [Mucisphaera calidilacus]|uniref:HTH-type transcriptional repressor PurR n=1 Tax=Mucisphaera calidilacus TaxID=2527982 RepID=A0A518BUA9_9BACT|nr:substrate-binding domain-containing protein [Mucisphaera calidilacus]QDU70569.1 HTH-type transcriptional repressor PurR [Mucisphaera calidilacus]